MLAKTNTGETVDLGQPENVRRGMVFETSWWSAIVTVGVDGWEPRCIAEDPAAKLLGCDPAHATRADCERFGLAPAADAAAHGFARTRDGFAVDLRRWAPTGAVFRGEDGERIELGYGGPTFSDERFIGLSAAFASAKDME